MVGNNRDEAITPRMVRAVATAFIPRNRAAGAFAETRLQDNRTINHPNKEC